jgi:hypothetical protein
MKNHLTLYTLIAAALFMTPDRAQAQVTVPNEEAYVNQYVSNASMSRRPSWWNALGRQLTNRVDKPYKEITAAELQNIIFFATHYKNRVQLADAVPALLDIFENNEDPQFRLMSVADLHAIGSRKGMVGMSNLVDQEPDERVRRFTKKAVANYFAID